MSEIRLLNRSKITLPLRHEVIIFCTFFKHSFNEINKKTYMKDNMAQKII